ncbi:hypothetical protein [Aurantimicrobium minutum]|uniref:hypothetical protein n=1 Tax=Aurantimicrobium minutum TaxID=708131 RepID=UPI002475AD2D|nr:hypothetical protein [Aurantimicrobium minutum]MDH6422290.1 hypothetical protein [Aurantimicrobium minutum]
MMISLKMFSIKTYLHFLVGSFLVVLVCTFGVSSAVAATLAWNIPGAVITQSANGANFYPRVVVDGSGNTTAVWFAQSGSNTVLFSTTRPAGGSWSAPSTLYSLPAGSGTFFGSSDIAVTPSGEVIVVWTSAENNQSIQYVHSVSKPAGGSWTAVENLTSGTSLADAHVAIDANGNASVIWKFQNGQNFVIQSVSKNSGGSWSSVVDLSQAVGIDTDTPRIVIDSSGSSTATWLQYDTTSFVYSIVSASKSLNGSWTGPTVLATSAQGAYHPGIVVAPNGTVTALWTIYGQNGLLLQSADLPQGGSWSSPVTISNPSNSVYEQQMNVNSNGDIVAIWRTYTNSGGGGTVIQSITRTSGASWNTPVNLSIPNPNGAFGPEVVIDSSGNTTATWGIFDQNYNEVAQTSSKPVGGAWETAIDLIGPGQLSGFLHPSIAVNQNGDVVAICNYRDSQGNYILAAFDAILPVSAPTPTPTPSSSGSGSTPSATPSSQPTIAGSETSTPLAYTGFKLNIPLIFIGLVALLFGLSLTSYRIFRKRSLINEKTDVL